MTKNRLKFIFLILTPFVILYFIIASNYRQAIPASTNTTDNSQINNTYGGKVIAIIDSYDNTKKLLNLTTFDLVDVDCSKVEGICLNYSTTHQKNTQVSFNENTEFYVLQNSTSQCIRTTTESTFSRIDFDTLITLKCSYIGGNYYFMYEDLNSNLKFTEFTVNLL